MEHQAIVDAVLAGLKAQREDEHPCKLHADHIGHHDFLELLIAREQRITARNERIKEKIAGTFIVGALVALVGFIGAGVLAWMSEHLK